MSEISTEEVPMVLEVNCSTGEQTMRPMTEEELAQREADRIAAEAAEAERVAAEEAAAAAKASALSKLTALGLTEEEALAIIGG
jgi:DNA-binding transcriptional regulator YhcF (GntR family)